jgi:cytochrome c peroxidase
MDPSYAERTRTKLYRTTPLRAFWQHPPYFHDGSAETLEDVVEHVVEHYDDVLELELSAEEMDDLVEYLKSI